MEFEKGDYVLNKTTQNMGRVVEVNKKWDWFAVYYHDTDSRKKYSGHIAKQSLIKVSNEERADILLALESAGITNYWE